MILEKILAAKRAELAERMEKKPLGELVEEAKKAKPRGFRKAISRGPGVKIICEFKRASPSGVASGKPLEKTVKAYEKGGAAAVSVVTEKKFFNGSVDDLWKAARAVSVPVLRKDFLTTEYELYEAKAAGASAVLLVAAACQGLEDLVPACRKIGLDALVEAANEKEIAAALDAGAEIIGINNRSFTDLSVDLDRARDLCSLIPRGVSFVAESGFKNAADVKMLGKWARVPDAVLVGTVLMMAEDTEAAVRDFVQAGRGTSRRAEKE